MKLFLDTKNRRFVKSAASNVALTALVLKRRDQIPLEIVTVANNAAVTPPTGTTFSVGLKSTFADANFLAFAAPGATTLDLFTEPVEAAFSSDPASIAALLEVKWGAPGEALRTATLQVTVQNSVILGTEATPVAVPDGKATQAEAEAGTDNDKWMTPLRTAQAIALEAAARSAADTALGQRIDLVESNLDTETLDSIAEAASSIAALETHKLEARSTNESGSIAPGRNVLLTANAYASLTLTLPRSTDGAQDQDRLRIEAGMLIGSITIQQYQWTGASYLGTTTLATLTGTLRTVTLRFNAGAWQFEAYTPVATSAGSDLLRASDVAAQRTLLSTPSTDHAVQEYDVTGILLPNGDTGSGVQLTRNTLTPEAHDGSDRTVDASQLIYRRVGSTPQRLDTYLGVKLEWQPVPPSTPTSTGKVGQIAYDGTYFYLAIGADSWRRTPMSTW